jgi:uncharacterized membrane protein YjgN (DUF898 family)
VARNSGRFHFDGGVATYVGTAILGALITIFTLGFCYPFALVLRERWKAKHSYIDGQRLVFSGSAWGLFGNWVKWLLLIFVTLGIYSFWVVPRVTKWKWENTDFDPTGVARSSSAAADPAQLVPGTHGAPAPVLDGARNHAQP